MKRALCLIAALLLPVTLVPAVAVASPVTEYQLQFSPVGEGEQVAFLIVNAVLDPATPLPATVTIPVPAGVTVLWMGELLGGDPSADPARQGTAERVGDMDVYTLTLEQAHTAQMELQLPLSGVTPEKVSSKLVWTNPGDPVLLSAAVVAEAKATGVIVTPASGSAVQTNAEGETLHTLQAKELATGETYALTATWTRGAASGSSSDSPVLPVLLGVLALAIATLVVVVLVRERAKTLAVKTDDEDDDAL